MVRPPWNQHQSGRKRSTSQLSCHGWQHGVFCSHGRIGVLKFGLEEGGGGGQLRPSSRRWASAGSPALQQARHFGRKIQPQGSSTGNIMALALPTSSAQFTLYGPWTAFTSWCSIPQTPLSTRLYALVSSHTAPPKKIKTLPKGREKFQPSTYFPLF